MTLKEHIKKNYTLKEFTNFEEFDCQDCGITSLEGIELLLKLEHFNCSRNRKLTSLKGIEKAKKLTALRCYDNNLENLDGIENLTNLKYLYCGGNRRITTLKPIEKLINLIDIDVSGNEDLTDIYYFQNMKKIDYVEFSATLAMEELVSINTLTNRSKIERRKQKIENICSN